MDTTPKKIAPVIADVLDALADMDSLAGWYANTWHGYDLHTEEGSVRMYAEDVEAPEFTVILRDRRGYAITQATFRNPGEGGDMATGLAAAYVDGLVETILP